jgi:hypothetical protein
MTAASCDDVAVTLGRSISDPLERGQVTQWLSDAELQIKVRLGDVALLDQAVLAFVEREAVAARCRNPEGYQSESIEDYSYRLPAETRQITILDEWWHMLDPDVGSGAFSARPYFEADTSRWPASVGEGVYFNSTDFDG